MTIERLEELKSKTSVAFIAITPPPEFYKGFWGFEWHRDIQSLIQAEIERKQRIREKTDEDVDVLVKEANDLLDQEVHAKCDYATYERLMDIVDELGCFADLVLEPYLPVRENRTTQPDGWVYELFYEANDLLDEKAHDNCDYATYVRLKEIMRELFDLIPRREL